MLVNSKFLYFFQNKDYSINTQVLNDIVDVFLVKEKIKFDVYVDESWTKSGLLDSFIVRNGHNFDFKLI